MTETDELNLVIRVWLSEKYRSKWHLVLYLLKKLSLVKQNFNSYNKKLLAIVILLKI